MDLITRLAYLTIVTYKYVYESGAIDYKITVMS
jgi:hypothetical protein